MVTAGVRLRIVSILLAATAGCSPTPPVVTDAAGGPASIPDDRPRIRVLGSVQDGGLPHAACACPRCERAARGDAPRRRIASLAILLSAPREVHLIDATPDIREQLAAVRDWRAAETGNVDRAPIDGVLLTHAHIGHYTGLAFFGFEAIHTRALPVLCTKSLAGYLTDNGPWSQLVEIGNIELRELEPGLPRSLGQQVEVTAVRAPHRDELSDTVGFVIRGPGASLLYVPDTDGWESWRPRLPELLREIDVAILDGTFYSMEELPGRDLESIRHPLMTETMDLLDPLRKSSSIRILFTHLNHSNPALERGSSALATVESRGYGVVFEGQEFPL